MPHKTEIHINCKSPSSFYEKRKIAYYCCTNFNLSHVLSFLLSPIRLSCQTCFKSWCNLVYKIAHSFGCDNSYFGAFDINLTVAEMHHSHPAVHACTCITIWIWPIDYLLTYSMEQSPSWETNWFAASQEIPHILWQAKVHYRIYACPPTVPNSDQILYYPLSIKRNRVSNLTLKAIHAYCIQKVQDKRKLLIKWTLHILDSLYTRWYSRNNSEDFKEVVTCCFSL